MTENLEKALKNTGLIQYKDKFQENDVDDTIFFKLLDSAAGSVEERLLAEIIPSVGHRFKLISAGREVSRSRLELGQVISLDFACSICGSTFNSFQVYWNHIREFHEITKGKARLNCPLCTMIFTDSENLQKHVNRKVCPVFQKISIKFPQISPNEENEMGRNIEQELFSPEVIREIHEDYKLAFIKSLQMSGGISLSKSNEILMAANSLVNSIIAVATNFSVNNTSQDQLLTHLNSLKNPFPKNSSSQYKLEKLLKERSLLVEAKEIKLGSHFKFDKIKGMMQEKIDNAYHFQLSETLPTILSKYYKVADSIQVNSSSEYFENFKSGSHYNNFKNNPLCLQIYYDDVEICNPLGSKAKIHKLAMFYFIIANFPNHSNRKLENIFPLIVVKSKFVKEYGMNLILQPLVYELNSLHENSQRLSFLENTPFSHIQVLQFCGDNLGMHTIFGFAESFNANFRCRFCKLDREQTFTAIEESVNRRRNLENYERDLEVGNVSLTGIRERSILNDIKGFNVTNNFAPDIMHDILEGICVTELKLFLKHVTQNRILSVSEINHRLSSSFNKNGHAISVSRNRYCFY
ncbi:uncharacterized protein LOC118435427 isoform X1 [Folsomia candida]|uniref:uncharacterized protein LOC118435427 isoform X1 n=1 Tax=Folsomia candida TaxID=158441 RepID=UPI001605152D|nr:uncharacterized protein LOC118435427 isoform X1 [Folsomia candida]